MFAKSYLTQDTHALDNLLIIRHFLIAMAGTYATTIVYIVGSSHGSGGGQPAQRTIMELLDRIETASAIGSDMPSLRAAFLAAS